MHYEIPNLVYFMKTLSNALGRSVISLALQFGVTHLNKIQRQDKPGIGLPHDYPASNTGESSFSNELICNAAISTSSCKKNGF